MIGAPPILSSHLHCADETVAVVVFACSPAICRTLTSHIHPHALAFVPKHSSDPQALRMDLMDTLGYNTSLAEALAQAHALTGTWRSITANLRTAEALTSNDIQQARSVIRGQTVVLSRSRSVASTCSRDNMLSQDG